MLACFFGKDLSNEMIDGKSIPRLLHSLIDNLLEQHVSIFYGLTGVAGLKLGLRELDRQVNRKIKVYNAWGKQQVEEKMEEMRRKN